LVQLNKKDLIEAVKLHVCKQFENDTSGHDHFHIKRVVRLASHIAKIEGADVAECELIAWLHELDDYKLTSGEGNCERLLRELGAEKELITSLLKACSRISFGKNKDDDIEKSLEVKIVQDADRLDAIGAIGIARTFAYGGKKGQPIYHPDIQPKIHDSFEAYKNAKTTTVNHFYEKLLLLRDNMNTKEGRRIAEERHSYLMDYLNRFLCEWNVQL